MSRGREDDALSWEGDDDPTLVVGGEVRPTARRAVSEPIESSTPDAAPRETEGLGSVALVGLGLIAGAYLFFAIGWAIAGLRLHAVQGLPVASTALVAATIVATSAPLLWFAAVIALTRRSRTWVRFAWLVAGIVLLVPWPFLVTGAI